MGLRYEQSVTKYVTLKEASQIQLNYRVVELNTLDENKDVYFIRYLLTPSTTLRNMDEKEYNK